MLLLNPFNINYFIILKPLYINTIYGIYFIFFFSGPHTERNGMREGASNVAEVVSLYNFKLKKFYSIFFFFFFIIYFHFLFFSSIRYLIKKFRQYVFTTVKNFIGHSCRIVEELHLRRHIENLEILKICESLKFNFTACWITNASHYFVFRTWQIAKCSRVNFLYIYICITKGPWSLVYTYIIFVHKYKCTDIL